MAFGSACRVAVQGFFNVIIESRESGVKNGLGKRRET
jgi:hypothetical protein